MEDIAAEKHVVTGDHVESVGDVGRDGGAFLLLGCTPSRGSRRISYVLAMAIVVRSGTYPYA
jgi:hypothetical protein